MMEVFYEKVAPSLREKEYLDVLEKLRKIKKFLDQCNKSNWASYNNKGIVPYCFWKDRVIAESDYYSAFDYPFMSGLVDGAYTEAEGLYHSPEMIRKLCEAPSEIIYAYTKAYLDCHDIEITKEEYAYVVVKLRKLEKENGIWSWVEEKWYEDSKEDLEEVIVKCKEAEDIRAGVDEFIEFVTSWDKITELGSEVLSLMKEYWGTLSKEDNIGRYERGKVLVPIATLAVPLVGEVSKIKNLKNLLKGLKEVSAAKLRKVADDVASALGRQGSTALERLLKNIDFKKFYDELALGVVPRKFAQELALEEEAVIRFYTNETYYKFNQALLDKSKADDILELEKLLNRTLDKIPSSPGSYFRGIGKAEIDKLKNMRIGGEISYENFVSTSADEFYAWKFLKANIAKTGEGGFVKVISKNGKSIQRYSDAKELEILHKSKSKFELKSFEFVEEEILNIDDVALSGAKPDVLKNFYKIVLQEK
jgi:hypothetical protein